MTDEGGLEARIRRLEDRWAIQELVSSYGIRLDNREYVALGELYDEEAQFVGTSKSANGRADIVEFYRNGSFAECGPTHHYHHGTLVTFNSDHDAQGIVSAHAENGYRGQMIVAGFRYHDIYRKGNDGKWRFLERSLHFHYIMPAEELAARFCTEDRRRVPGTTPLPADLPEGLESFHREPHALFTVID